MGRHADARGTKIFAARLGSGDFRLRPDTRLGGLPIDLSLTMLRATHPDGTPRFDLFAFTVRSPARKRELLVGELVSLAPVDVVPSQEP